MRSPKSVRLAGAAAAFIALAAPAAAQTVQELTQRLEAYEAELRRLTGAMEQLAFEQRRDRETLEALLRELNYRVTELEGGDPTEALRAPPLFGEAAPPAAAPVQPPAPTRAPTLTPTPAQPVAPDAGAPGTAAGPGAPPAPLGVLTLTPGPDEQAAFDAARRDLDAVGLEAGRRAFDAFLSSYPDSPLGGEALWRLGDAYATAGRPAEAARAHLRAVRDYPDPPFAAPNLLGLAASLESLGRRTEACSAFREYLSRHADADASSLARASEGAARTCS